MRMAPKKKLIEFPCHFPVKIIGNNTVKFIKQIEMVILKHFPEFPLHSIKQKKSSNNQYISLTVTVHVANQASLDAFYQDITSQTEVKWVL